jgi:hypothetical protein
MGFVRRRARRRTALLVGGAAYSMQLAEAEVARRSTTTADTMKHLRHRHPRRLLRPSPARASTTTSSSSSASCTPTEP